MCYYDNTFIVAAKLQQYEYKNVNLLRVHIEYLWLQI